MSSGFSFLSASPTVHQWDGLQELLSNTQIELSGTTGSAFAPGVQADARAFIATWAALAGESSTMAAGFADALRQVHTSYGATDDDVRERFAHLDSRLGPGLE